MTPRGHLRDFGLRFLYVGAVASTNDYWNLSAHERRLLKVVYEFPGRLVHSSQSEFQRSIPWLLSRTTRQLASIWT